MRQEAGGEESREADIRETALHTNRCLIFDILLLLFLAFQG
jgi:hypothetical protein